MATVNKKLTPADGWVKLDSLVSDASKITVTSLGGTVELAEASSTPTVAGHPLPSSCSANYIQGDASLYARAITKDVSVILT